MFQYTLVFSVATLLSLALTPRMMQLAGVLGAIDRPDARRMHSAPTPRLGGLAVFASIALGLGASLLIDPGLRQEAPAILVLTSAAAAIVILGLIDDCVSVRPSVKLVVETAIAIATFASGYRIEVLFGLHLGWAAAPVTILWIIALTNAFNMIDGLDGLATGIGAIISATLFALAVYNSQAVSALILAALCGALFGFLPYNFFPAKIFLGDSGSLLLGFLFALISIRNVDKSSAAVAISIPLLALGLPLGEMVLTITRRLLRVVHVIRGGSDSKRYEFFFFGRAAVFTADKAHIHHRLIDLGLNQLKAVLFLYGVCTFFCLGALALIFHRGGQESLILGAFSVAAIVAVRRLGYREFRPLRNGLLLPLLGAPIFELRAFQVLLDLGSITAAYICALLIWSRTGSTAQLAHVVIHALPLICFVQIVAFAASGLYRGAYRLSGVGELLALIKALVIAAVASWAASFVILGWQPNVLISLLDTYLLGTLIIGWRFSFFVAEHYFNVDGILHNLETEIIPNRQETRGDSRGVSAGARGATTHGVASSGGGL
jgi:UDP-GlcNAc:undecaprenyl-phosphate GlcNAc-1-phosphate transferase